MQTKPTKDFDGELRFASKRTGERLERKRGQDAAGRQGKRRRCRCGNRFTPSSPDRRRICRRRERSGAAGTRLAQHVPPDGAAAPAPRGGGSRARPAARSSGACRRRGEGKQQHIQGGDRTDEGRRRVVRSRAAVRTLPGRARPAGRRRRGADREHAQYPHLLGAICPHHHPRAKDARRIEGECAQDAAGHRRPPASPAASKPATFPVRGLFDSCIRTPVSAAFLLFREREG